jgi:hypothetical protein
MFAATAIPSLLFLIATFLVPESPRWLAAKGRDREALGVLERLGGRAYARQVLEDFRAATALRRPAPCGASYPHRAWQRCLCWA